MLTQSDLQNIDTTISKKIRHLVTNDELKEAISHLPSKDEFYTKMDEVMGELKAIREEQILISGKVSDHTDELEDHDERIKRMEKRVAVP